MNKTYTQFHVGRVAACLSANDAARGRADYVERFDELRAYHDEALGQRRELAEIEDMFDEPSEGCE